MVIQSFPYLDHPLLFLIYFMVKINDLLVELLVIRVFLSWFYDVLYSPFSESSFQRFSFVMLLFWQHCIDYRLKWSTYVVDCLVLSCLFQFARQLLFIFCGCTACVVYTPLCCKAVETGAGILRMRIWVEFWREIQANRAGYNM